MSNPPISRYNRSALTAPEKLAPAVTTKGPVLSSRINANDSRSFVPSPPALSSPTEDRTGKPVLVSLPVPDDESCGVLDGPPDSGPARTLRGAAARSQDTGCSYASYAQDDALPPRKRSAVPLGAYVGGKDASESGSAARVGQPPHFSSVDALIAEHEGKDLSRRKLVVEGYLLVAWSADEARPSWQRRWCRVVGRTFVQHVASKNSHVEACIELVPGKTEVRSFFRCTEEQEEFRAKNSSTQQGRVPGKNSTFLLDAGKKFGGVVYCDAMDMAGQQGWVAAIEDVLNSSRSCSPEM